MWRFVIVSRILYLLSTFLNTFYKIMMMNVEVCNRQPYLVFIIYFSQYVLQNNDDECGGLLIVSRILYLLSTFLNTFYKIMMMNVEVCNRQPYLVFVIYFSQYFLQNNDDECGGLLIVSHIFYLLSTFLNTFYKIMMMNVEVCNR